MGNGEDMRKNGNSSTELSRLLRPHGLQQDFRRHSFPQQMSGHLAPAEAEQPLDFSTKRPNHIGQLPFNLSPATPPEIRRPSSTPEYPSHLHRPSLPSPLNSENGSTLNNSDMDSSPPQHLPLESIPMDKPPMMLPCLPQLTNFGLNTMLQEALAGNTLAGNALAERYSELHQQQQLQQQLQQQHGNNGGLLATVPNMANLSGNSTGSSDTRKPFKYTRPFKAYPRDPLSVPLGYYGMPLQLPLPPEAMATQTILSTASDQAYLQFREQMLATRRTEVTRRPSGLPNNTGMNGNCSTGSSGAHGSNSDGESNGPMSSANFRIQHGLMQLGMGNNGGLDESSDSNDDNNMCNTVGTSSMLTQEEASNMTNNNSNVEALRLQVGLQLQQFQMSSASRKRSRALPEELKDDAYWERRRKNNEAAKRSRDARRAKEDEIAIRAAFLEQENLKLRVELAALKSETAKLRCLMYNNN